MLPRRLESWMGLAEWKSVQMFFSLKLLPTAVPFQEKKLRFFFPSMDRATIGVQAYDDLQLYSFSGLFLLLLTAFSQGTTNLVCFREYKFDWNVSSACCITLCSEERTKTLHAWLKDVYGITLVVHDLWRMSIWQKTSHPWLLRIACIALALTGSLVCTYFTNFGPS